MLWCLWALDAHLIFWHSMFCLPLSCLSFLVGCGWFVLLFFLFSLFFPLAFLVSPFSSFSASSLFPFSLLLLSLSLFLSFLFLLPFVLWSLPLCSRLFFFSLSSCLFLVLFLLSLCFSSLSLSLALLVCPALFVFWSALPCCCPLHALDCCPMVLWHCVGPEAASVLSTVAGNLVLRHSCMIRVELI